MCGSHNAVSERETSAWAWAWSRLPDGPNGAEPGHVARACGGREGRWSRPLVRRKGDGKAHRTGLLAGSRLD